MNTQVAAAVLNNIAWCGLVCDSHGIIHTTRSQVWGTLAKAPLYYPDVITASILATAEDVMYLSGNREITSLKDSFANLDMWPYGFRVLFEAEWIFHEAVNGGSEPAPADWRVISTEQELASWTSAIGLEHVIKPELLRQKDVKIFVQENDGALSGFIASLGAGVVGLSNVFSANQPNENLWSVIPSIVATEFPGMPLAGYESSDDLAAALSAGWTSLGPLRVWIK